MADIPLIRWEEAPGPYAVAFSTRVGGVSAAPFDTLNLGRLAGDDPEHVAENRRRLCVQAGADHAGLRYGRQMHGALVRRAEGQGRPGDGLWSDTPGEPLLVFTADCLPVALARTNGDRPAIAALHVGWRGLLAGVVENAAAALGGESLAAVIGPGIGPCCYEVGPEVAEPASSAAAGSTSGPRPRRPCRQPARRRSGGSTGARPAIRSFSSRTAAMEPEPAGRG